ncbi:ATP-binding cassette domain-containing protein [Bifidobacterium pullorum subsp. saeculare]|uniref:ATP-binding cassette domain-containing protein n=1 Tax=Bifidobacterium pullorum subsp. saeculare TaxID=78257 RepID=A0A938WXF3_9BIFI|nr:ABC transporter ATP-binding protein/permease [Bifidobacterium pullorum]MBM6698783.1 ATP-binding cassette domain-containing protein [Bifidobacterium pullorum subsp. saeculare]
MLQIKGISKQYKTGDFVQQALDDVSLNLRDNEFVAILGPSGSGKTTLLNIIGGLDRYDQGDLVINGISTRQYKDRDWDAYRNHTIGFVFQSYNLIPHQSILSNVELALTIGGVPKSKRRHMARRALKQVGLGAHVDKKPNQLSGGQMQRVAIARALVNDPDIVLADEPTGALDSATSVQIMDLLKEVAKDRLVVMVTHNPELAREYATRIVELKDGVIRSDSNPYDPTAPSADGQDSQTAAEPVRRTMGRTSMSLLTSLALSFNNLKTKKGRTILTSFAGSIGIIGIALIMSVSAGVNTYIDRIQRDTMTAYPITIDAKTFDLGSIMSTSQENMEGRANAHHKADAVYPDDSSIKDASAMTGSITENNLSSFKKYLDKASSPIHQYVGSAGIQYSYDTRFSVYSHDPSGTLVDADGVTVGSTGGQSMASQMAGSSMSSMDMSSVTSMQMSMLTGSSDQNAAPDIFHEIMPSADGKRQVGKVVADNYQVVDGAWPKQADEVVLVLDKNNTLPLTALYELGLKPAADYHEMMNQLNAGDKVTTDTGAIDYTTVLDQRLSLLPASDQYVKGADGHWQYVGDNADEIARLVDSDAAIALKVVGVVKPIADAKATPLGTGVGYTRALTDTLIDRAEHSQIVADQQADQQHNVLNGMTFAPSDDATKAADAKAYVASLGVTQKAQMAQSLMSAAGQQGAQPGVTGAQPGAQPGVTGAQPGVTGAQPGAASMAGAGGEQAIAAQFDQWIATADEPTLVAIYNQYVSTGSYRDNMANFGVVSRGAPSSISIYADSFEDKDSIEDQIADYNKDAKKADRITYTDYVGLMMDSVTTIINVITYVLIAFVAVSLVVSSIMIGIITYISVLERTKEIGILRAMGASKRNVSNVFNAETGIIGLFAGLIGVALTVLLNVPINAVLHHFMGTDEVSAVLPVPNAIALVILSVVLTLIGGLIPSRGAAKQDPATALRTE